MSELTPYPEGQELLAGIYAKNTNGVFKKSEGALFHTSEKEKNDDMLEGDILFSVEGIKESQSRYPHMLSTLNGAFKDARFLFPGNVKRQLEYCNSKIHVRGVATQYRDIKKLLEQTSFSYAPKGVQRVWAHRPIPFGAQVKAVVPDPQMVKSATWKNNCPPDSVPGRITLMLEPLEAGNIADRFMTRFGMYIEDKESYIENFVQKSKDPSVSIKEPAGFEAIGTAAIVNSLIMMDRLVQMGVIEPIKMRNTVWKQKVLQNPMIGADPTNKEVLLAIANLLGVLGGNMEMKNVFLSEDHVAFGAEAARQILMAQFYDGSVDRLSFGYDSTDRRNLGTFGPIGELDMDSPYGRLNNLQLNVNRNVMAAVCDVMMGEKSNVLGTSLRQVDKGYLPLYVNTM